MLGKSIKTLLDSEDLEMVRLGVTLMKEVADREDWEMILNAFCFKEEKASEVMVRKWTHHIDNDEITIKRHTSYMDLWRMKQATSAPLLNMTNQINLLNQYNQGLFKYSVPYGEDTRESI